MNIQILEWSRRENNILVFCVLFSLTLTINVFDFDDHDRVHNRMKYFIFRSKLQNGTIFRLSVKEDTIYIFLFFYQRFKLLKVSCYINTGLLSSETFPSPGKQQPP